MAYVRAVLLTLILVVVGLAKSEYALGQEAAVPVAAPVSDAVDADKALSPGDTVSLEIVEDKAAPVHLRISDTGFLQVPWIGNVSVLGKSCTEAAVQIKKKLEAQYYPTATVRLSIERIAVKPLPPPIKVSVLGKVTYPGLIEITNGQKIMVSQAISKAGGATQFGNLSKVMLTRRGQDGTGKVYHLDIKAVLSKGQTEKDMQVQDGDAIMVPANTFNLGG